MMTSLCPTAIDAAPQAAPCELNSASTARSYRLSGDSAATRRLREQIERIGPHFRRVLLCGESGSALEQVARGLRAASPVASGPFVRCGVGDLEEIASVWKQDPRLGRIALRRLVLGAAGGMLWIEEVSSLSAAAQGLVMCLLEERGPDGERFRIAAGTTANLRALAASGAFSQDLRVSLGSIELQVSPLRERAEDIATLAHEMVQSLSLEYGLNVDGITADVLTALENHCWPGNEADLENALRMAVLSCGQGMLQIDHLPRLTEATHAGGEPASASDRLQDVIDQHLLRVLAGCDGNKLRAADRLGISRSTLYRMLDTHNRSESRDLAVSS